MTNQQHPITPPDKLVQQWHEKWFRLKVKHVGVNEYIATEAARWGADAELEACCAWTAIVGGAEALRNHRRPQPSSLAEDALELVNKIQANEKMWQLDELDVVRAALERLKELENGNE